MDFSIGALTSVFGSVAGLGVTGALYFIAGPRQLKPSTTHAIVMSARKLTSPWHQSKIVVKDSGVMYLKWGASKPIEVPLKVFSVEVKKENEHALVLNDKMKINADVMFQVSVSNGNDVKKVEGQAEGQPVKHENAIATAVGAFNGDFSDANVKLVLESRFDSALRLVAANMDIEQINTKRDEFLKEVTKHLNLEDVGFKLNEVSLRALTPALLAAYNPSNSYDAVGMKKVVGIVQESETVRNETEQQGETRRAETNKVQALSRYTIEQEQASAELAKNEKIAKDTAEQKRRVAEFTANNTKEARLVEIQAAEETGARDIAKDRQLELSAVEKSATVALKTQETTRKVKEAEIATNTAVNTAQRDQEITLSLKNAESARATATANEAEALAVVAKQAVVTAQAIAEAERTQKVQVIESRTNAEKEAVTLRVAADAKAYVAEKEAEALRTEAQGIADAQEIDAKADANATRARAEAKAFETLENLRALAAGKTLDAEAVKQMNEAFNILTDAARDQQVDLERVRVTPEIVEKMASALQKVGNMTILSGMPSLNGAGNGGATGTGNMFEDAISASQRAVMSRSVLKTVLGTFGGDIKIADNVPDMAGDLAQAVAAAPVTPVSVIASAPAAPVANNDDLPPAARPAAPQAGMAP